jgi:hypothetical protein
MNDIKFLFHGLAIVSNPAQIAGQAPSLFPNLPVISSATKDAAAADQNKSKILIAWYG